jgi:hypothetical protein
MGDPERPGMITAVSFRLLYLIFGQADSARPRIVVQRRRAARPESPWV